MHPTRARARFRSDSDWIRLIVVVGQVSVDNSLGRQWLKWLWDEHNRSALSGCE